MKILFSYPSAIFFTIFVLIGLGSAKAQYKSFSLTQDGDTVNVTDKKNLKQGKWIISVGEVRGEPGYDEEGVYKSDKKEGVWRKYSAQGDLLSIENYRYGGKDGIQQYFSFVGQLLKEEEWHSYNPDAPYDTIPIYGADNNQILEYKIVKAQQYSVPHGTWKYYDAETGRVTKVDKYDRGMLLKDEPDEKPVVTADADKKPAATTKPKEKAKPAEVLEYEKKYSKKKRSHMEREGHTSL
jgi:hypothetical protein